jgi:CubicO group peptidase (beta-lactamase class C family)
VRFVALIAFACVPAFAGDFERIVEDRLAQAETPGCIAVALVAETTQVKLGCTPRAGPLGFDADSLFEIGSISKTFTGLLLADMVRKGEVTLDDPAAKYARPGAKLPKLDGRDITLGDLVTQSSGLPRMPPRFSPSDPRDPYADFTEDKLYEALAATRDAPASKYEYSNFGFMWLSSLLARAGGKPYDALVRERILAPLGMKDTALELGEAQRERFTPGHNLVYEEVSHWGFATNLAGVGGLRSSLNDMARFAGAVAGRAQTPLEETIARALEAQRPAASGMIGYAWHMYPRDGQLIRWHNGGTGGFRSIIAVNRATKTAAVVLVDSDTSFDDLGLHLVDPQFALKKKRVALPTDVRTLEEYVGRYEIAPGFAIDVFVEGTKLMAQASAQRALEVHREAPDVFFYYEVPVKLRFSRGANAEVDAVTLEQAGRNLKGQRAPSARRDR